MPSPHFQAKLYDTRNVHTYSITSGSGAGIYAALRSTVTVDGSQFAHGSAEQGAALYIEYAAGFSVRNAVFEENTAVIGCDRRNCAPGRSILTLTRSPAGVVEFTCSALRPSRHPSSWVP